MGDIQEKEKDIIKKMFDRFVGIPLGFGHNQKINHFCNAPLHQLIRLNLTSCSHSKQKIHYHVRMQL